MLKSKKWHRTTEVMLCGPRDIVQTWEVLRAAVGEPAFRACFFQDVEYQAEYCGNLALPLHAGLSSRQPF